MLAYIRSAKGRKLCSHYLVSFCLSVGSFNTNNIDRVPSLIQLGMWAKDTSMNITNVGLSAALLFVLTVQKIVRDEVANQMALEDPTSSRRYLGAFEALSSIRSSQLSPLIAAILRDGTIHYLVLVYYYRTY